MPEYNPRILITGASGMLGKEVCRSFDRRSIPVRTAGRTAPGNEMKWFNMDLSTGEGIDTAVSGIDTVIHCASATRSYDKAIDVRGTAMLLDASRRHGITHFIYISIVGIDHIPMEYYQYKVLAEQEVIRSNIPYTIVRATQFHELVEIMLMRFLKRRINFFTKGLLVQPIEIRRVAEKLFNSAYGPPLNSTIDIGGKEVLSAGEIARQWLTARHESKLMLGIPLMGWRKSLRNGALTCSEHDTDSITWNEWLLNKYGSWER